MVTGGSGLVAGEGQKVSTGSGVASAGLSSVVASSALRVSVAEESQVSAAKIAGSDGLVSGFSGSVVASEVGGSVVASEVVRSVPVSEVSRVSVAEDSELGISGSVVVFSDTVSASISEAPTSGVLVSGVSVPSVSVAGDLGKVISVTELSSPSVPVSLLKDNSSIAVAAGVVVPDQFSVDDKGNGITPAVDGVLNSSRVEGVKQSYLSAVQKKSTLSKHDLAIVSDEGGQFVQVPDDILQNVQHLWDDLIIGKFPDDSPHIAKVHVIVNKIWAYGNKQSRIDAFVVNKSTIKFRIRDPIIRDRVLRRGMWNIADKPMMVSKYGPIEEESAPRTMSLWVSITQIPKAYYSWKGLSFLSSVVGEPKRLHPDTELCNKFDEAKVFIEVDLTKPLPDSYTFKTRQGDVSEVKYSYPWLPPRCCACGKWGHLIDVCRTVTLLKRGNDLSQRRGVNETNLIPVGQACATIINSSGTSHSKPDPPHPVYKDADAGGGFATPFSVPEIEAEKSVSLSQVHTVTNIQLSPALSQPVCRDSDVGDSGGSPLSDSRAIQAEKQAPVGDEGGWSLVSPKNSAHSRKVNSETVVLGSPSRYSVLAGQEDSSTQVDVHLPSTMEFQETLVGNQTNQNKSSGLQQVGGKKVEPIIRQSLPRQSKTTRKNKATASNLNRQGGVPKTTSN